MAISFVSAATAGAADGGDPSLTLSSVQENDLVIVAVNEAGNGSVDIDVSMTTSGYTEIADLFADDVAETNLGVFYKFMPATPDATAVGNGSGDTNNAVHAAYMAFRGVDLTTPFDVSSTTATGTNTFDPDPPSIDYTSSGVWVVVAAGSAHNLGIGESYTFPTGYTTDAVSDSTDDDNDATVGMGYNSGPGDPEDPGALAHSGTDSGAFSWAAVTMALRPAAAAATVTMSVGHILIGF